MKTKLCIAALIFVSLLFVMPVSAAKSKYSPLTKKYKDASLEQVLNDIEAKTGYKLAYMAEDLDLNKRITMTFKDTPAKTVLKKVLDKDRYDLTSKKGVITISLKPEPPVTYQVLAIEPSEIQDDSLKTVRIWQDTTYSVACKTVTKELPQTEMIEPEPTSKGHYIQAFLGAGYSQVGYKVEGGKEKGFVGGLAQLQYAYFFHENWGVTVGAGFELYNSQGELNHTYEWDRTKIDEFGGGDSEQEAYIHRAEAKNWKEKQMIGMVNIPIGIQCQYPVADNKMKIYAGAGIKVGVPVLTRQKLVSGELQHTGYYPMWNLTLDEHVGNLGDKHDFYTEQASDFNLKNTIETKTVAVAAMADLGVAIPVTEQIDLMIGAYCDYTINNIQKMTQQSLGWHQLNFQPTTESYREHAFMNDYQGMAAASKALHPWLAGLKVGVQWHHKPKAKPAPKQYERIQTCDTTYTLAQRTDTTFKPQPEVAKRIVRLMNRSVIWFDLDKWEPKLEPADILDRIAELLIAHPEQKILVNGHASKEGQAQHNQMLSDKRAEAVANLLLEKGVRPEQITTKGYSSQMEYVADEENTEASNAHHNISLDRRVEILPLNDVEIELE